MEIDWRALFADLRVPWRDRGANCSKGNVNICCPWCHNDPSYHLGVAEAKEAYYCYREPNRHSGSSFVRLLIGLGQPRAEAIRLLNKYRRSASAFAAEPKKLVSSSQVAQGWARFDSAADSDACLRYLADRGFINPKDTALRYDLRYAKEGTWAQRLLIPFPDHNGSEVVTWTGRAMRADLQPRYMTLSAETSKYVYAPDVNRASKTALVLVEGPLDALKLADTCRRSPAAAHILVAALLGKQITAAKLLMLRNLFNDASHVLLAMDADVSVAGSYAIIAELASSLKPRYIARARLPTNCSDPAEVPAAEVVPWLTVSLSAMT